MIAPVSQNVQVMASPLDKEDAKGRGSGTEAQRRRRVFIRGGGAKEEAAEGTEEAAEEFAEDEGDDIEGEGGVTFVVERPEMLLSVVDVNLC